MSDILPKSYHVPAKVYPCPKPRPKAKTFQISLQHKLILNHPLTSLLAPTVPFHPQKTCMISFSPIIGDKCPSLSVPSRPLGLKVLLCFSRFHRAYHQHYQGGASVGYPSTPIIVDASRRSACPCRSVIPFDWILAFPSQRRHNME